MTQMANHYQLAEIRGQDERGTKPLNMESVFSLKLSMKCHLNVNSNVSQTFLNFSSLYVNFSLYFILNVY